MKGKYTIKISDKKVSYSLVVDRKVTVISGNSGTGKTTLYSMILEHNNATIRGVKLGVSLICDREVVALTEENYETVEVHNNKIFVADENLSFLNTKYFASLVKRSGSYFIFISREPLGCISYSLSAMVGITSKKEQEYKYTENYFYSIYSNNYEVIVPDLVITEDEKSGKEFFSASLNIPVESAYGSPMVLSKLKDSLKSEKKNICVIIDREGFGPYIKYVEEYLYSKELTHRVKILAPRSFEYLLLKGIFYPKVRDELDRTYDFCDASEFNSWEIYYEDLLKHISVNSDTNYSKSKISLYFIKNRRKVLSELEISESLWK